MTLRTIIKTWTAILGEDRRFDVELLAAHTLGQSRAYLLAHLSDDLMPADEERLQTACQALTKGTPLQYLTNEAWFMGESFYVDERVLIPRFDTEILVEAALQYTGQTGRLLDLCTGSGAIAITFKKRRPAWWVGASDLSEAALAVAQKNGERLQALVDWRCGDLFSPWAMTLPVDCIVSNPPYISEGDYAQLPPDVQQEPKLALLGGKDGLDYYRKLCRSAHRHLLPGGRLLVEIGADQGDAVRQLFASSGFDGITLYHDAQGLPRVVAGVSAIGVQP